MEHATVNWAKATVARLQAEGVLLVEDGNHGEYRPRPSEFVTHGTPFIRAADMFEGRILFDKADHINRTALSRIRKGFGERGDILLSHKGTVGKVAMASLEAEPFVCSPQTTFWRVLNEDVLDRRYLFAYMRSKHFVEQLNARKGETDMADYVSLTSQRGLHVLVPPIEEQRAIAHILGTLDDKIELNRRMNQTLEEIAHTLFKSWFVDFDPVHAKAAGRQPEGMDAETAALFPSLFVDSDVSVPPLPVGWEETTLADAAEINPARPLRKGEVAPYLDMANVPIIGSRAIQWVDRPYGSGMRFRSGDVLLARITPCLENGKTAFVDFLDDGQIGWGSTEFIVLRSRAPLPPQWAYCLARDPSFREFAIRSMSGTSGRQRVPAEAIGRYRVVVPPRAVAERFAQIVDSIFLGIKQRDEESRTLASIRDALLPRLLSGELRVPVPDAEARMEEMQ